MLVEAAWQAVRGPGPLRAFYQRIARRRGNHIAAVAVARKLAVIIWHLLSAARTMPGCGRRCTPRSCATSSSAPASRRAAASGASLRLQSEPRTARGEAPGRTGRNGLPTSDRGMEPPRAAGAHGRRKGGATLRLRGRAPTSRPALCRAVAVSNLGVTLLVSDHLHHLSPSRVGKCPTYGFSMSPNCFFARDGVCGKQ